MQKIGEWIAKLRYLILLAGALLILPAVIGMTKTRVNYDLLSYLPDSLETVNGQNIMVDEFGSGAFSMIVVENMKPKEIEKLTQKLENVDHVKNVLWYGSVLDSRIPVELLPDKYSKVLSSGDSSMIIAFMDDTTSSDASMEAVRQMRRICGESCFVSGMTGIVADIADLCMEELPVYVVIAAVLSFIILELVTDSFLVPVFFLLSIGLSILYNLGSNVMLGQISYVTQALTAVLQLAVTTDYSIFLLESFEESKEKYPDNKNKAMGRAIAVTCRSVVASSITTVAGFLALCVMTFALGRDIGIVMSKGVLIGVVCCLTILPAMILTFDKWIVKTRHKPLIKSLEKPSAFIIRHYRIWSLVFLILIVPAAWGNLHTKVYYNIAQSLPADIPGNIANAHLEEEYHMTCMHVILMDKDTDHSSKRKMLEEIEDTDGVKWTLGLSTMMGPLIPESFLPDKVVDMLRSDKHEIAMVCSQYEAATDEANAQLAAIQKIVKKYDPSASVIGEAPMMKDLQDTTDVDLKMVNVLSIAAIFVIILFTFKSVSLPVILVAVIEFAIQVNMAFPYYQNTSIPFVASIVIGTIQLGATVDYAILMTNRYVTERKKGADKVKAVSTAHQTSMLSVITSGCSFFVATFGVAVYSRVDMIGSICTLLSRGALISMITVLFILPSALLIFDRVICLTTSGLKDKAGRRQNLTFGHLLFNH